MPSKPRGGFLQEICQLAAVQSARELGDRELLERFLAAKDQAAFAILVERHGQMVLGVCRRALDSAHDAEDACQTTFLVLAQKAASIRKSTSLTSWLHGVAARVAAHVRRERVRRCKREQKGPAAAVPDPAADVSWREVRAVLDEELERLPETLRAPLILCYLEGRTRDEAAHQLGLRIACLHGRLERGRKTLCQRLTRRGVTLSAALVAAAVGEGVARAALPPATVLQTVKAAAAMAGGRIPDKTLISTRIISFSQEVARTMAPTRLKLGLTALLCAGLLATALASARSGEEPKPAPPANQPQPAVVEKPRPVPGAPVPALQRPTADERISGRVLGPDGKPVAGAKVYLLQWAPYGAPIDKTPPKVRAETDKDGRFSFTAPRHLGELFVTADGFAPGWDMTGRVNGVVPAGPPLASPPVDEALEVRLAKDDVPVNGRLLDIQGEPVAGATVRVYALNASPDGSLDQFITGAKNRPFGVLYHYQQHLAQFNVDGLAHFFPPVTSDKDGRFQIKGIGRDRVADLTVEAPAITTQVLHVVTRPGLGADEIRIPENLIQFAGGKIKEDKMKLFYPPVFTHSADPCRVVAGVVRDKATGKPITGAVVRGEPPVRYPVYYNQTTTDQEGRYRLTGLALPTTPGFVPGPSLVALPPQGQPYLPLSKAQPADREAKETRLDFDLPPGVWLEGQVKDKATGRGVPAQLRYFALSEWKLEAGAFLPAGGPQLFRDPFQQNTTDPEGRFRLLVAAERAVLAVTATGPGMNRYRSGVGADKIKDAGTGEPGGGPGGIQAIPLEGLIVDSFDALVEVKPEHGAKSVHRDVELDPGQALTIQVRGPDGKPLDDFWVHGRFARSSLGGWNRVLAASETTLHGLESGKKRTLLLEAAEKNLAARHEITGDERGPLVITLEPAGAAVGRVVDDDGRPLANAEILVYFRLAPNPTMYFHSRRFQTDDQGKFRIDGLVPEMTYQSFVQVKAGYAEVLFQDLSLKSGKVKDLGEVKVKKPDGQ